MWNLGWGWIGRPKMKFEDLTPKQARRGRWASRSAEVLETRVLLAGAVGESVETDEDVAVSGDVLANEVGGGSLTASLVAGPSHGVLMLNSDGTFTYTPAADYHGLDSFVYRVQDGAGASAGVRSSNLIFGLANDAESGSESPLGMGVGASAGVRSSNFIFGGGNDIEGGSESPLGMGVSGGIGGPKMKFEDLTPNNVTPEASLSVVDEFTLPIGTPQNPLFQPYRDRGGFYDAVHHQYLFAHKNGKQGVVTYVDEVTHQLSTVAFIGLGEAAGQTVNSNWNVSVTSFWQDLATGNVRAAGFSSNTAGEQIEAAYWLTSEIPVAVDASSIGPNIGAYTILAQSINGTAVGFLGGNPGVFQGAALVPTTLNPMFDSNGFQLTGPATSVSDNSDVIAASLTNGENDVPAYFVNQQITFPDLEGNYINYGQLGLVSGDGRVVGGYLVTTPDDPNQDSHGVLVDTQTNKVIQDFGAGTDVVDLITDPSTGHFVAGINFADASSPQLFVESLGLLSVSELFPGFTGHRIIDLIPRPEGFAVVSDSGFVGVLRESGADPREATVRITVNSVNDAPVAQAGTLTTDEDTDASGRVSASDVDGDSLTYSVVTQPTHGSVTLNPDGSFTYSPAHDYHGPDRFAFRAWDSAGVRSSNFIFGGGNDIEGGSESQLGMGVGGGIGGPKMKFEDLTPDAGADTATVSITVNAVNDAPTLANAIGDQSVMEGSAFTFAFAADTFADVDAGDSLTYSATRSDGSALPSWLSFDAATRTFAGTPTSANVGRLSIRVMATDTSHVHVSETFDIAVLGTRVEVSNGVATLSDVGGASNDTVGLAVMGGNLMVAIEGMTSAIPIAGLTNLMINGGGGNDTLTLDFSGGTLPFNITFNGGVGGNDKLAVIGDDVDDSVNYTPGLTTGSGTLSYNDGANIRMVVILELEPVDITGVPSVTVSGSSGVDNFTLSNGFDSTMGGLIPAVVVSGKRNGVTIEAPHIWNVGSLTIDTGAGNDVINAAAISLPVALIGGAGNDTLTGGTGNDTLSGGAGRDSLNGGAGTDTVVETTADAVMTLTNAQLTGNGTDQLTKIERAVLTGTSGNNTLDASAFTLGNVTLLGGDGNDMLIGGAGNDSLDGGAGSDVARQSSSAIRQDFTASTRIVTGAGDDLWTSIEGLHFIVSGSAATTLNASQFTGNVTLAGGSGNDVLIGGSRNNVLSDNAGNDLLTGGNAADTLSGGTGNDSLVGNGGNDLLNGQGDNDTLRGNAGDDHLIGEEGSDKLFGGSGNDLMEGGAGNDVLTGEAGDDSINGGAGSDAISGGDGNDVLNGGLGNDTILGGIGADVLRSGGGSDRLAGGSGDDRFVASGSRISLGGGDDTVSGSGNTIDAVFVFDFERLLV